MMKAYDSCMENGFETFRTCVRLITAVLALCCTGTALAQVEADTKQAAGETSKPKKPIVAPLRKLTDVVPAERLVDAGGVRTYFVRSGEIGPEILLLHGFGSSTYTWRKNLDALGRIGRVTAIDIKGFGLTEKPKDGQYSEAAYARHVLAAMDALGIRKPVIVGNSMGGAIAARVALEHPERCSGLILVDAVRPFTRIDFEAGGVDTTKFKGRNSILAVALVRSLLTRDRLRGMLESVYEGREPVTDEMVDAYFVPTTIEGAPEALLAMMNPPPETAKPIPLTELKCPVTVLWGGKDNVIPLAAGEALARDIPGAELVIWAAAGHMPHEDEPDKFHDLLRQFMSRNRPGGS
ncbi:alpha/beta fold hydrolase [bacterium]|nr:alpha/beta fold hydrolase [bacterium]